ncbi:MAG: peptide chain release factor 1 [Candidatus Omnitrophica bacterium 4484_70.1]|nr:MAG: peptide chain release factor 1 [Candidatus Omnitrophica bacterium 4484_70.1]
MIDVGKLKEEYSRLSQELAREVGSENQERYQKLVIRFAFLEKILNIVKKREKLLRQREEVQKILSTSDEDKEVKELAKEELAIIEEKLREIDEEIDERVVAQQYPDRDLIVEIRAAAGGEEAALFAADLFKMYSKYAEKKGWQLEVLNSHPTDIGGFKEVIFSVKGEGCYLHFKFESGVHRVQRVPVTETGGRIHTSTTTVAVLVEPKEIELRIDPQELKIETFRASGHGGQYVNRTDSAVRITHLPTGIVVSCQDARSQLKNKEKAMRVLKARLLDKRKREEAAKITEERKGQIGTGERSEKIRTYNFPERRVTDHRINLTIYRLEEVMEGDLDFIVKPLIKAERKSLYEAKGLA